MTLFAIVLGLVAVVALGLGSRRLRGSQPAAARALAAGTGIVICAEGIGFFALRGIFDPNGPDWGTVIIGVLVGAFGFLLARFIWRSFGEVPG
jgi:hypothetical protein